MSYIQNQDKVVYEAIQNEYNRQNNNIELIASENFVSEAVMEAQGSVMTNKYQGYPGRRYYGGCDYVDVTETIAIERAKALFVSTCKCATTFRFSSKHGSLSCRSRDG